MVLPLKEGDGGVLISVRAQPRASKNEVAGVMGDALKIRITAPPVEGEANEALRKFLAGLFGVARGQVEMLSGQTGRNKVFKINGITFENACRILDEMGIA